MTRAARVLAALPLVLALAACNEAKKPEVAKLDRPVLVVTAHYRSKDAGRILPGVVKPRIESDLGFRVPGKVARRLVDNGAAVAAGQTLAMLDDTDFKLQREQAGAEFDAAGSALSTATNALKRTADLRKEGFSTKADLEKLQLAMDEAQGRVNKAQRAVALAENALTYATLTAGTAGVVTAALVEAGQVVAAGQPAMRVAALDEKEVLVAVPEVMVDAVARGEATVSLWSVPGSSYPARLRELSPAADTATRTYAARFSVPGAGTEMQLGMTASVAVSGHSPPVARLPLAALFDQGGGPHVFVVDGDGALTLKPVEVVGYEADQVVLRGGVDEGDRVVALGVQKLDAGQKVRVVAAQGF